MILFILSFFIFTTLTLQSSSTNQFNNSSFIPDYVRKGPYVSSKLGGHRYSGGTKLAEQKKREGSWMERVVPAAKVGIGESGVFSLINKDEDLRSLLKSSQLRKKLKLNGALASGRGQVEGAICRSELRTDKSVESFEEKTLGNTTYKLIAEPKSEYFNGSEYLLSKLNSEDNLRFISAPIKKKITQVYKKLADDFQSLENLMVEERRKCNTSTVSTWTTCPTPTSTPNCQIMGEIKTSNNIITIENINGDKGNFTRVTLIKRKVIENKQNLKFPKTECGGSFPKNCSNQVTLGFDQEGSMDMNMNCKGNVQID